MNRAQSNTPRGAGGARGFIRIGFRAPSAPGSAMRGFAGSAAFTVCLGLGLGLGLVACSVGPAYRRPAAPLPAAWQAGTAVQQSQSDWPTADWWRGFGSNTLDDYVHQALAGSDDIAAAVARVHEAEDQAQVAGAPLYPALSGQVGAEKTREFSPPDKTVTFGAFEPLLSASYELDFWGKNRSAHQAALLTARASAYDRETVVLTVLGEVASDYFQALEMRDRLAVATNSLANAQAILSGLQTEQQVGTGTALDVAQQAAVVAVENATIPPLRQQLQQSMDALAILLGRAPETLQFQDAGLSSITAPPVLQGLPSQLLARRPDIAQAEAQLHAANADIGVARAAFFPDITLTATGGYASSYLSRLINPSTSIYSLSGSIVQAIFQGGALRGQYHYSQAHYAELLADYHKSVLSALSDVENALVAVQQTADQQVRQQDAADKAQRAYDFAQQQMRAGVTNILTVLNTETTLFTAQDQLVQVKFQHLQALVNLYTALGGGWQQGQTSL
ncbi:MAG TPA: efflux transporter outer membrane subunit [Steroidobacteraceae bacterium]|nr:efflux transporter outer membrane subunit [Steroidobacteraceae bacterium]